MGLIDWASLAVGAGTSIFNWLNQEKILKQNQANQEITWQREDTAVQRRAADLKAAGMNPVLAAGQGASSMAPIRLEAPQLDASPVQAGLNFKAAMERQKADIAQTNAQTILAGFQQQKALTDIAATLNDMKIKNAGWDDQHLKNLNEIAKLVQQNQMDAWDFKIAKDTGTSTRSNGIAAAVREVASMASHALKESSKSGSSNVFASAWQSSPLGKLFGDSASFAREYAESLNGPAGGQGAPRSWREKGVSPGASRAK